MEEEKPSYYAVIPASVRYNEKLNSSQKLFYGEITALTFKTGECWASNNYFARIYKVSPSLISNWLRALEKEKLIIVDYKKNGKEIIKRIIKITGIQNIEYPIQNIEGGYSKYLKENNTSINNNKLNEFNLYNNFHENKQCECMTKSNIRCSRKSSFNINGKNYCNQHARDLIPNLKIKNEKFKKPTLEEVEAYCKERNNNVDAELFINHYDSNGWKVGKNSMKDWKACIRTWERNRINEHKETRYEREMRLLKELENEEDGS